MKGIWETLNKLYINNGLKIFPVIENAKLPMIKNWQNECSSNFMQILYWTQNAKNCNWGMPATPNNLFIIDLDVHDENKNGVTNFQKLCHDIGLNGEQYQTLIQSTPSGGCHIVYKSDEELSNISNGSNVFKDYLGIDFRTDGYIVVEPSTINGKPYKFENTQKPNNMPEKLKAFILENAEKKKDKNKTPYVKPKEIIEHGSRDTQLFLYISNLYRKTDLDIEEIEVLAQYFNQNNLEEPFSEKDVSYKVKKAFEKPRLDRILLYLGGDDNGKSEDNS